MFNGVRFLAVIPARGGSKGLKRKNIQPLGGKPLLVHTIEKALKETRIDRLAVSSEDSEMLDIARKAGAAPVLRPRKMAGDRARTEEALLHTLDTLEKMGETFDFVLTLEPTHPFLNAKTIGQTIELMASGRYDSCMTLTEDRTDFWRQRGASYRRLFPNAPRRRQERDPLFKENSLVYATSVPSLRRRNSVIGGKQAFIITPESESLDIHTAADLALAEAMLKVRA